MPVPAKGITKSKTLKTTGTMVGEILSRRNMFCYLIPKHQRAYSWESESPNSPIKKFLEDIDSAKSSEWVHNFGSLDLKHIGGIVSPNTVKIVQINDDSGVGIVGQQLEVNDGQQRIITFFLTLAAITAIRSLNGDNTYRESLSTDLATCYEIKSMSGAQVGYRIRLQETELTTHLASIMFKGDSAAYLKPPANPKLTAIDMKDTNKKSFPRRPMDLMSDAYRRIRHHLGKMDSGTLNDWEEVFYKSEIVTTYSNTPSHVVFESRNARGVVVSELDKVKNKTTHYQNIFTEAKASFTGDIVKSWWNATKNMEDGEVYNENNLLGYALTIVNGKTVGKGDYNDFLTYYKLNELLHKKKGTEKRKTLEQFVEAIEWISKAMKEVYKPDPKEKPMVFGDLDKMEKRRMTKVQRTMIKVNLIHITNRMDRAEIFKPVVLLTYHFVQPKEFVRLLDLLEKIIFRVYLVNKARTDNGSRKFGELCNEFFIGVKDKSDDKKVILKYFNILHDKLCDWARTDEDGLSNEELYNKIKNPSNAYKSQWTRYFLYHWEMSGTGSTNPTLRMSKTCAKWAKPENNKTYFTIEHIMPKTGWEKYPKIAIPALVFPTGHEKDGDKMRHYWLDKFVSSADYDKSIHYLGNLVLSIQKYNTIYSNLPFKRNNVADKNYLESKSVMYNTLPGIFDWTKIGVVSDRYSDWNLRTIEHRQERMARWARIHWRLPCEEIHLVEPQDSIEEYRTEKVLKSSDKEMKDNKKKQITRLKEMDVSAVNAAKETPSIEYLLDLSSDEYDTSYKDANDYDSELEKNEKKRQEKRE